MRSLSLVLAAALSLTAGACGSDPAPPSGSASDVAPDGGGDGDGDAASDGTSTDPGQADPGGPGDAATPPDAGPDVDPVRLQACEAACAVLGDCPNLPQAGCVTRCVAAPIGSCEAECAMIAPVCELLELCFDVPPAGAGQPWSEGPYGDWYHETAGPISLDALPGTVPFDLPALWTGHDSYIFLLNSGGYAYPAALWSAEPYFWLSQAPANVHFVFMAYPDHADVGGADNAAALVTEMKARVDGALAQLRPEKACHWRNRLHYVPTQAWAAGGWIQALLEQQGTFNFAVDRFQRIRQVGLLDNVVTSGADPQLSALNYEARYFDFEWHREQALVKEGVTEVVALSQQSFGGGRFVVDLPEAATMAGFDTLEIDLASTCEQRLDSNCFEWDYLAHLRVCDTAVEPTNAWADTACTAADAEAGVEAEALPCECTTPYGETVAKEHRCRDDGSGFDACGCGCSAEMARWITTYSREGRWITDATPFLYHLREGGPLELHMAPGNPYNTELTFRLRDSGSGARPSAMVPLFAGGQYTEGYNDKYVPQTVAVPADVTRVELVALITGHGFGADVANCAEFCNHTHHFDVNGQVFVKDHPWASIGTGCAEQIEEGTVPNQYGTWPLGRGGWCPGKDVPAWRVDVTDAVTKGADNVISYQSLFDGAPYVPAAVSSGSTGFWGRIDMESWLVFYR